MLRKGIRKGVILLCRKGVILLCWELPWPTAWSQGRFEVKPDGGALGPTLVTERRAAIDAATKVFELGRRLYLLDELSPVGRQRQRAAPLRRAIRRFRREARPPPVLGPGHEAGAHWVSLDIAQNRQQVIVALDRKCLEPKKRGQRKGVKKRGHSTLLGASEKRSHSTLLGASVADRVVAGSIRGQAGRRCAGPNAGYRTARRD